MLQKFIFLFVFIIYNLNINSNNSIYFIENKGQIAQKDGIVRNDIHYKIEQPGTNIYFKPEGLIYHFYQSKEKTQSEYSEEDWKNYHKGDLSAVSKSVYFFRMDLQLINVNKNAEHYATGVLEKKHNYYLAHCPQGITNVRSYKEITYKNIYPNIDIRYYFVENNLKYEFIIHPGGDIKNIQFKYEGSTATKIVDGKLIVENNFNTLIEEQPITFYQASGKKIESNFKIENGKISFDVDNFNSNETIIIDPTITWASYYNNNYSSDFHGNSAFDSQNNIYTCYATYGNTWPTINAGAGQYYDAIKDGSLDLVIIRFNANYSVQWVTYYGGDGSDVLCGTGGDYGKTLTVDGSDFLYVGGKTSGSTVFPTQSSSTGSAFYQDQTKLYGGETSFLLKFNQNGVRQWATMFQHEQPNTNSAGMDINGICAKGNKIYFTGETYRFNNNDMPLRVLPGAYNNATFVGDQDIFIGRFDSNCILEWSTYFNAGNTLVKAYKQGTDLHIDANGNLLFVGQVSASTAANGASAYLLNSGGGAYFSNTIAGNGDIIVSKFNSNMQPVWSTLYGSTDLDRVSEVSADINGNILVACRTVSGNNFPTANPGGAFVYTTKQAPGTWSSNGAQDGAVIKFTPTGVLYWATYIGGTSNTTTTIPGISSDNSGNIYVIGYTNTNNFPVQNMTGSYNQAASAGGNELVLMRFTAGGVLTWSTYYGDTQSETCYGLKITPSTKHGPCDFYKQFNGFSTNSTNIPLVNPGSPALFENTKLTTNANAVLLIEHSSASATSTPPTSILGNVNICSPDSTTLTINGGTLAPSSTWTWYTGSCNGTQVGTGSSITVSPTTTTTYYVNAIGPCDTTACVSITVTVNTSSTYTQNIQICSGNNYTLPGGNSVNAAGTYTDTIANIKGCDSIITTNLTVVNTITINTNASICNGTTYTLPGGGIVSSTGTYNDTLLSSGGCDSIISTTISIKPNSTFTQNISICIGSSYTLPGGSIVNTAGTYHDTLLSANGCDSAITTNLSLVNAFNISQNASICSGSTFTLPGGNIVSTAGSYIDTLTSVAGCDSIITTTLTINPAVAFTQNISICTGNTYTLPGGSVVTVSGLYHDTLTTSSGCDSIINTNLTVLLNSFSLINTTACSNQGYTLPNGNTVLVSGIYKDTLTNSKGCDSIVTVNLTINPSPIASVSSNVTILLGASTTLTATGFGTYNWFPSTGLNASTGNTVIATPTQTTIYCVEVTDPNGCKDTVCVTVTVDNGCGGTENLAVPNAFSPNSDAINETFCLQGWDKCIKDFSIVIFNRWGEKVFESKDPKFCWDGLYKNKIMDSQVLVYYINAIDIITDEKITRNGNISLIK